MIETKTAKVNHLLPWPLSGSPEHLACCTCLVLMLCFPQFMLLATLLASDTKGGAWQREGSKRVVRVGRLLFSNFEDGFILSHREDTII